MSESRHRYKAASYRFSPEEHALMDRLAAALALPGHPPLSKAGVIRVALRRLADHVGPEKKSGKKD